MCLTATRLDSGGAWEETRIMRTLARPAFRNLGRGLF
jgi:hypothetical protein